METKPLSRLKYVTSVTTKWVWRNIKIYGICTFHWQNCEKRKTKTRGEVSSLIVKNNDVIPNGSLCLLVCVPYKVMKTCL